MQKQIKQNEKIILHPILEDEALKPFFCIASA